MKDKILDILKTNTTLHKIELMPDPSWIILRDDFEQIADEILALFSINPPHDCSGDDCITCRNMRVSIGWNAERLSDQIVSLEDWSPQPDGFPVEDL